MKQKPPFIVLANLEHEFRFFRRSNWLFRCRTVMQVEFLSGLGAEVEKLPLFWLAAPLAGLIIQPIIGLSSDKTWTRLGRRIPFILIGSIFATSAMFFYAQFRVFRSFNANSGIWRHNVIIDGCLV